MCTGSMASLLLKADESDGRVIELRLGVNRIGRGRQNDILIDDPSVSNYHCELLLSADGLILRDMGSTNGTFVDGRMVDEISLRSGQVLRLGQVQIVVESVDFNIAIPKFDVPRPAPPVVLEDGALICPRHPQQLARYQCEHCREVLCDLCVHRLRRRGGRTYRLCPLCSHKCQPLHGEERKPKKSIFDFLKKTVKVPTDQ